MVERISSQKLLESETRQKSREVKDTQTLRMWCVEQAIMATENSVSLRSAQSSELVAFAKMIENYILGRVVSS